MEYVNALRLLKAVHELERIIKKEAAHETMLSLSSKRNGQSSKRTSESSEYDDKVGFGIAWTSGVLIAPYRYVCQKC